jgi:alpha-amylase
MATPSEIMQKYPSAGEIDVPELGGTVSWADLERDASCWLGNTMQWAYYTALRRLESLVKETGDEDFLKTWRYLQTSDHLYYMFTAGGGPGEVHSYFSHFNSPIDAYVTSQAAILDFENRVRLAAITANEPFLFYTDVGKEYYTGMMVWSLIGLMNALQKIEIRAVEFHNRRKDFEKWAEKSLRDGILARELKEARLSKAKGDELRGLLVKVVKRRFEELSVQVESATEYF